MKTVENSMFISTLNRARDDPRLCSCAGLRALLMSLCRFSVSELASCHLFLEHSRDIVVMPLAIVILSGLCNGEGLKML